MYSWIWWAKMPFVIEQNENINNKLFNIELNHRCIFKIVQRNWSTGRSSFEKSQKFYLIDKYYNDVPVVIVISRCRLHEKSRKRKRREREREVQTGALNVPTSAKGTGITSLASRESERLEVKQVNFVVIRGERVFGLSYRNVISRFDKLILRIRHANWFQTV